MTRGVYAPPREGKCREVPCKNCTVDALNSKYTGCCYDNANGKGVRCYRCATEKMLHCSDIRGPLSIQPALALMGALEEGGEEDERVPELRDALRDALDEDEAARAALKTPKQKSNGQDEARRKSPSEVSERSRSRSPSLGARDYRARSPPSRRVDRGSTRKLPARGAPQDEQRGQGHEDEEVPAVAERRARLKQLIVQFADDLVELLVR